jgi:predicted transcriptional regulator
MTPKRKADLGKVLGSRQASILEYLWLEGPQSVSQLHRALADVDGVAYTTVFTELSRMLKKGLVAKSSGGGSHLDM